jgi:hypothetical protein
MENKSLALYPNISLQIIYIFSNTISILYSPSLVSLFTFQINLVRYITLKEQYGSWQTVDVKMLTPRFINM